MTLYEAIFVRKSIRSYDAEPIDQQVIDELVDFLSDLNAPFPDIDWDFDTLSYDEITQIMDGPPSCWPPIGWCCALKKTRVVLQNCGYLGQMAVLWLTARGYGTCWQEGWKLATTLRAFCLILSPSVLAKAANPSAAAQRLSAQNAQRHRQW